MSYHFVISGFKDCPYFEKALAVGDLISQANPDNVTIEKLTFTRDEFHEHRKKILGKLNKSETSHTTCPMVYTSLKNNPVALIGGFDDFSNVARTEFKLNP